MLCRGVQLNNTLATSPGFHASQ